MSDFSSRLYRAMKDGDGVTVKGLLDEMDRAPASDRTGATPMPLFSAILSERLDFLRWVLDAGVDVNLREVGPKSSMYRLRALEAALWSGEDEMAELLLRHGASVDFATHLFRGDAVRVDQDLARRPALLGEAFLRPTYTLLHVAADLSSADLVRVLVSHGVDPNAVDADGHGPLRLAARNEPALGALDALLDAGAEINHGSKTGITALTAAVRHGDGLPTVRRLLERGADPGLPTKDGTTPLMKAASNRLPEAIKLLLAHGASRDGTNRKGLSALAIARAKGCEECVELLS